MTLAFPRSLLLVTALVLGACGTVDSDPVGSDSDYPPASVGAEPADPGCPDQLDEAVELLSSGLPTYDYDPAPDVATLVARTHVVLTGRLHAVERALHGDLSDQSTVVSVVPDAEVLGGDVDHVDAFDVASLWPTGIGPDPLANAVELIDLRFVAFLHEFPGSSGLTADVQGLFVACGDGPFDAVIESVPPGAGATIDDLVAAVRAVTDQPVPLERQLLGVEYYGACGNEVLRVGDETWYPLQWDEQRSFDVDGYAHPGSSAPGPQGLTRIAPPGPGDDVGALFVYADGFARFISDSGLIDLWMTLDAQTYEWEC